MQDLIIEETKKTPRVEFHTNGKLSLIGKSYAENARDFYKPVMSWINELNVEEIDFDVNLDYTNTASAKILFELLRKLDTDEEIKKITINWH